MVGVVGVFVGVSVLFFVILAARGLVNPKAREKICAICAAVSVAWITLLVLRWLGLFDDILLLGLLMGQSALGVYYLVEGYVKKELQIFRLPFLLSLTALAYVLVSGFESLGGIAIFLGVAWIIFIGVYYYRTSRRLSVLVNRMVECCKRW